MKNFREIWNLEFLKIQKMRFFKSFCILTTDVFLGFLLVLDLGKMTEPIFWAKAAITWRFEPFQNWRSKMDVLGPFSTLYEKMVLIRLETPKTKIFLPDPSIRTISGLIFGEKWAFPQNSHFWPNPSLIFWIGQNGHKMGRKCAGKARDMIFY